MNDQGNIEKHFSLLEEPLHNKLGQIRNFAWVVPSNVARGEQPRIEDYEELFKVGIRTIISLREAHAPPDDVWAAYYVEDEANACYNAGLLFRHIPCVDKFIPDPEAIVEALIAIDEELAAGRPVFLHCLFGVGRTGLIIGAWSMVRTDRSLDDIAREYFYFFSEMYRRKGIPPPLFEKQHREFRVLNQWWALLVIATTLGLRADHPYDFPPEPPVDADQWERKCQAKFIEWIEKNN